MEHTETPWMAYGTGVITGNAIGPIDARTREDAAFIVLACNHWDSVVEAGNDLIRGWDRIRRNAPKAYEGLRGEEATNFRQALEDLRAILTDCTPDIVFPEPGPGNMLREPVVKRFYGEVRNEG
jgi:hypothetical protein